MSTPRNNPIQVVVSGGAGSGKSAVAEVIRQALKKAGLKTEVVDDNGVGVIDEAPGVIRETLERRLERIRGQEAHISTKQAHRTGVTES